MVDQLKDTLKRMVKQLSSSKERDQLRPFCIKGSLSAENCCPILVEREYGLRIFIIEDHMVSREL